MNQALISFGVPVLLVAALACGVALVPKPAAPTAAELAEVAVGYIKAGKSPLAWQELDQALRQDPRDFRANYVAGMLAFMDQKDAQAEQHFKTALAIKPDDVDANLTLGAVYQRKRQYDQAVQLYQKVRQLQPGNAKAIYNLGMVAVERYELPVAKQYLTEYARMAPDAPDIDEVRTNLRSIDIRLKERDARKGKQP